jgi:hypothetical protein
LCRPTTWVWAAQHPQMLPFVCLSGGGFVHQWTANLQKTGYYCHLQRLLAPILADVKSGVLYQEGYFKKLALKFGFLRGSRWGQLLLSHMCRIYRKIVELHVNIFILN